jgi:hypothetical protein
MTPNPIATDVRFSARVDYFESEEEAVAFAKQKIHEGFNVNGGSGPSAVMVRTGIYKGLFPVHWVDRKGEGFYG